ncbi:hypothetical protein PsorP6_015529 [Peronosclerospora sorghi]|uniref:Uncharacterized protein n=1 Tax=Peronosclerospora sorghi TaxID=230839 RepID=A0ACC0WNR5_9STRA|nr:hypothetical protein PsorP6_015529 [Peronosclerospora sorghi]
MTFCILQGARLRWYRSKECAETDTHLRGDGWVQSIESWDGRGTLGKTYEHTFAVRTRSKRSLLFSAENARDRELWLQHLERAFQRSKNTSNLVLLSAIKNEQGSLITYLITNGGDAPIMTMRSHVARWISKRPRIAVRSRSTHTSVMMIHSASVLDSFKDALYKGRELADRGRAGRVGQGGRDDELDARGETNTAKGDGRTGRGGGELGAQDCRNTMERRVLVRHLERPHAQVDRVGAICTRKKLTTAGDTSVRSRRRLPRVLFARDEQ